MRALSEHGLGIYFEGKRKARMLPKLDLDAFDDKLTAIAANPKAASIAVWSILLGGSALGLTVIILWMSYNPTAIFAAEVPGRDSVPEGALLAASQAELSGVFKAGDGEPSDLPGYWPNFRGPDHDSIVKEEINLAESWGPDGPEVVWQIEVGDGYAAPAVFNGCVYLMDYDVREKKDALRCISLADGKEIWRRSYELNVKRNHGMSRTIPAVTEKYIVTMGPKCHVVCLDTVTGEFRWGFDLQKDYGTEEPLWYAGQCPIIVDDVAIIAPAGTDVLMMGIDCESGDIVWETPNPRKWKMSHSSIIPMTLLGKKTYVYSALGGVAGISAEGPDVGKLLWDIPWTPKVVAPSPVQSGDDLVFVTAGYGTGSMMLQVSESNGSYSVDVLYETEPNQGLACEQQTPIFHDGVLYSIMPKDAGELKGQFAAYRPDGAQAWTSGNDNRFGLGPFLLADNKFLILDDEGTLTMLDAAANGFKQLDQADILPGHDAWGPLAMAGTRLLVRDMNYMACVELGEQ